ncbi:MAG: hypothetical protein A2133_12300 [Actinobacteria bacterium RBG_16_64_13]|nr:MAG: hypothetical protein A2133_12300 [Actinobacteria bacterium RBG_16_64_13]
MFNMSKKLAVVLALVLVVVIGTAAIVYAVVEKASDAQARVATVTTAAAPNDTTAGVEYTATGTRYDSATTSISITKVSTGSRNDKVTYYVAHVQLQPGTIMQSALAGGFELGNVAYTSDIAAANDAILAVNGDYFSARNTGVIIRSGVLYLDNPARRGLAMYKDGTMEVYDETAVSADQLLAEGVWNTFSFGPALLVDGFVPVGLDVTEVEDIGEEWTILGSQPRTGVGIVEANHFVLVVVDGRSPGYSSGVTLSEFAEIFRQLGCSTAYNLDGGGSAAMYFMGDLVNDPLGSGRERGISDILYVK